MAWASPQPSLPTTHLAPPHSCSGLQVAALGVLEDLVLSDNVLRDADLGTLTALTSLRQLTLMGCRMRRVPPAISRLTRLQVGRRLGGGVAGCSLQGLGVRGAACNCKRESRCHERSVG